MSGRLPYVKRKFYPHMIFDEAELWTDFINKYPERFDTVDYDFRVGEGVVLAADNDEEFIRMAKMLSQKRIDVIAWNDEQPTIIEVKTRVGLGTLGQLLGYKLLFKREFTIFPDPDLMVVTKLIDPDDTYILLQNRIKIAVLKNA
ncbi:hypothetical protein LCGC14_2085570 [marine sediment metagenome]|uniref:Uncharacterized protein n=1 Tax=marine sediment metagenome TaxID=412755 RepID=A0A0F9F1M0_9ZZZZ